MQRTIKTVIDFLLALISIIVLSPIMIIAAIGILISSKGPILYKAKRMGKGMKEITVYKFRTMRVGADKAGSITGAKDSRIFPWGNFLRLSKIDELPQLFNILNGTMSVVGPRPEDINIVKEHYTEEEKHTLDVVPGLASPGSIFNYTHGDQYLDDNNAEDSYTGEYLRIKLALDLYYLKHWNLLYDVEIIWRTIYVIIGTLLFHKQFDYPREYKRIYGGTKGN